MSAPGPFVNGEIVCAKEIFYVHVIVRGAVFLYD